MINRVKLIGVIILSFLLLTNCKKDNEQDNSLQQGELVFSSISISMDKSDDVPCEDLIPTHAKVLISGKIYLPQVYNLDGNIYTEAIKLDAQSKKYVLEEFSLVDEYGVVIKTTPMEGSEYAEFIDNPLPRDIYIAPFETNEMAMEVLCFYPDKYDLYGFEFFEITELSIRKQYFFGNFCISDPEEYWYSLYGEPGNITVNEPAIFKIRVFRNGDFIKEYLNVPKFTEKHNISEPLAVPYADYDNVMDRFKFELWIYVKVGNDFDYVKFHEWTFFDDEVIKQGSDGITDFVLGNCNANTPDLLLPPYINLPGELDYTLTSFPNQTSTYKVMLSNISTGYDLKNGKYNAWSADFNSNINLGQTYNMKALSSLYPEILPGNWSEKENRLAAANWLMNNTEEYENTPTVVQNALWMIFDGIPATGAAAQLAHEAMMHTDFSPLPGEYAGILFFENNSASAIPRFVQVTFVKVES